MWVRLGGVWYDGVGCDVDMKEKLNIQLVEVVVVVVESICKYHEKHEHNVDMAMKQKLNNLNVEWEEVVENHMM
ncbi:hypothetical protein A2U01_0051591, partial [Trifolium medium]|nr:hypothetical protein [Trifolium medium]